ncbi:MAG: chromate transporter [Oscillospiraceae bacterium]|nr:chromate transporter [Oscillospiraceae bacterium]MBR7150050.1 chromate transporter [Oscillospiraceae bacterium]
MTLYLQLFLEFFKTGLFAVGGGMATLPFLYDISDRTGWFTHAQLADMIAVSESTPGPIGVNMATYVGYLAGGIPGSLAATMGLVTPSFIVIMLVAMVLQAFRKSRYVIGAFYGLRPASAAMITAAGVTVARASFFTIVPEYSAPQLDWRCVALAALLLLLTRVVKKTKKFHPIVFIAFSAVVGVVFRFAGA